MCIRRKDSNSSFLIGELQVRIRPAARLAVRYEYKMLSCVRIIYEKGKEERMMLNTIKNALNTAWTENGARTHASSLSDCLDLFFRAGGMRQADPHEIETVVMRAYTENPVYTLKTLFYIRDIRGGMGERRFFRIAMQALAKHAPEAVLRNVKLFSEYGRYDDLLILLDSPCAAEGIAVIRDRLDADLAAMREQKPASLLAKWLPSVNASNADTCAAGKRVAKLLHMQEKEYRKMLSALRKYTDILENRLRESDYTFDYAKQPSCAMLKYRAAFIRNDNERYAEFLAAVKAGKQTMHADALYPYDIIRACRKGGYPFPNLPSAEKDALDAAWNALPAYGAAEENALAVVDGSGSMYGGMGPVVPIDIALSLGIYFAEHNKGAFANHFITFSSRPKMVEIKGTQIADKAAYCASYNEAANTDLEAVFRLILETAVRNSVPQAEMPAKLYIISDMEFDYCVTGGNRQTLFDTMQQMYEEKGYRLPEIVFWNVTSRHSNIPVTMSQTGAALVSGASPAVFDIVTGSDLSPLRVMEQAILSERYAAVS